MDADARGKTAHGTSRIAWLATLEDQDPAAVPERLVTEEGYERWEGRGALGYLTLSAIVDAQLASPPGRREWSSRGTAFLPASSAPGCDGSPTEVSSRY